MPACECECANLFLVLLVSPPSAQLMAAACSEIQPATLVQHPRRFPLPLAKKSKKRHYFQLVHIYATSILFDSF